MAQEEASWKAKFAEKEADNKKLQALVAEINQMNADWEACYLELESQHNCRSSEHADQLEALRAKKKAKIATIRATAATQEQLIAAKDEELTNCKHENAELVKQVTEA